MKTGKLVLAVVVVTFLLAMGILAGGCSQKPADTVKKEEPAPKAEEKPALAPRPEEKPAPPPTPPKPVIEAAKLFTFPGDWGKAAGTRLTLFYPAQASWQFVTGPDHPGSGGVLGGMACQTCHSGQERKLGQNLVEHAKLEPDPIKGKAPFVDVDVKAAYDDEYLYLRFEWASERPGVTHTLWRYDGEKWVKWGGPKPDAPKKQVPPSYEDRLALLIADREIPAFDGAKVGFSQAGCFVTCHNSMRKMPEEPSSDQVKANPYLGDQGLKMTDIRKYLLVTRTAQDSAGAWDKVKSKAQVEALFKEGSFLDLWQWRAARSNAVGYAGDDYVLDYRLSDKGKSPFTTPAEPQYMYNASAVGFNAIPEDKLEEMLAKFPLIVGKTGTEMDPNVKFNVGDILPQPVLREPDESSADILANGTWQNGKWVVELRRKLNTGNPDDKAFEPGKVYTVGIAVFDDMVSNRRHYVSFEKTLGIGGDTKADIVAIKVR